MILDVLIGYDNNGDVDFKVGMKKGTALKYINKTSDHSQTVLKELQRGVFERLTKLIIMNDTRRKIQIEELYPKHVESLKTAELIKETPTFREVDKEMKTPSRIKK